MLSSLRCIGNGGFYHINSIGVKHSAGSKIRAHISTNTAINKSLRRTSLEARRGRRPTQEKSQYGRPPRAPSNVPRRTLRPNYQEGLNPRNSERYNTLKPGRFTKWAPRNLAQEGILDGSGAEATDRGGRARYDYSRKPGGNRATRRAARYGHSKDLTPEPQTLAFDQRALNRRAAFVDRDNKNKDEHSHKLSTLQDLDNDYGDHSSHGEHQHIGRPPQDHLQATISRHRQAPLSIPYTTPASEFLYGTSVVIAAMLSSRRKLYKLYIYDGENREARDQDLKIRKMAVERGIVAEKVAGDWLRLMDKMSTGRPHNVRLCIIEDSNTDIM